MTYESLLQAYDRIQGLLESYPLIPPPKYRLQDITPPPSGEAERVPWALTYLEIPRGGSIPFCTPASPAREAELARFLESAEQLHCEVRDLTRQIVREYPALQSILTHMAEECGLYLKQAKLQAENGSLSLSAFRTTFGNHLAPVIRNCCLWMFSPDYPVPGAALMMPIRAHLEHIGIHTADHQDLRFDFNCYEPYFIKETTDPALDERYHSILMPACFLGKNSIVSGKASCYSSV